MTPARNYLIYGSAHKIEKDANRCLVTSHHVRLTNDDQRYALTHERNALQASFIKTNELVSLWLHDVTGGCLLGRASLVVAHITVLLDLIRRLITFENAKPL